MNVSYNDQYKALIVQFAGELDHHTATAMRGKIDDSIMATTPKRLIFDLSSLSFMDSSGVGVIMGRYRIMKERGGEVIITNAGNQVSKLIDVSGLRKIVREVDTLENALKEDEIHEYN